MKQRIILNSECKCNANDSAAIVLDNGDTFKLNYRFTSLFDGRLVDLNKFDFEASFWIYGHPENVVTLRKSSISGNNVIIDPMGSSVKFLFRDYSFSSGKLWYKFTFKMLDPTVPGSWITDTDEGYTGIILK